MGVFSKCFREPFSIKFKEYVKYKVAANAINVFEQLSNGLGFRKLLKEIRKTS